MGKIKHFKEPIDWVHRSKIPCFRLRHAPKRAGPGGQLFAKPLHLRPVGFGLVRYGDHPVRKYGTESFDHTIAASKNIKTEAPVSLIQPPGQPDAARLETEL